jgi:trigger factor
MARVETQVEELADNRVRLTVEVPSADVKHAVEHATSDLAESAKVPGFRKGKVPAAVLLTRLGRDRVFTEAVESHIGGWFWNAAATTRIRPIEQPQYDYDLPASDDQTFQFQATVAVQPKPELADWTQLEVPAPEPEIPAEVVDEQLEVLRSSVAQLVPVEDRPVREGDTIVGDLVDETGEAQRDYVVELGSGRLVQEIEDGLVGAKLGEPKEIEYPLPDGSTRKATATVTEIKEKLLPPLDDDLAVAASEFSTLEELRADVEGRLRDELEDALETQFRAAAIDMLVDASKAEATGPLVEARTAELLQGLLRQLEARGIPAEAYLQVMGETPQQLQARLHAEATRSVSRELVLEALADQLELQVSDEEIEELVREQSEAAGDDPDEMLERIRGSNVAETLRADLRLRKALDRLADEVKRIPVELARAREQLWTPEQEKTPTDTKIWTPCTKEPA